MMGEHKHNPNVILAEHGLLPKKKPKISLKEFDRLMLGYMYEKLYPYQKNMLDVFEKDHCAGKMTKGC